jgi:hypothetical protein
LITSPRAAGLPYIIEVLRGIQEITAIQVDLMQQARRTPGALDDIMLTQMDRAYCAQRAECGQATIDCKPTRMIASSPSSRGRLPVPSPLRTVRASFPAHSSSLIKASLTRFLDSLA